MPRPRLTMTSLLVATAAVMSGCGGVDIDTDAAKEGFEQRAEAAYDAAGKSREDDASQGTRTTCFALDDEAIEEIASVLDLGELADTGGTYLVGVPGREGLTCPLGVGERSDDSPRVNVTVSTTDQDLEDIVELQLDRDDNPPERLDGEADGLDADRVAGFGAQDLPVVLYVDDGLSIVLTGRGFDADQAFEALPVVVEQVGRVLTSD